jgi:hypothetical protein
MFPAHLRREIVILLAFKAAALTLLYLLCFSPSHRPQSLPVMLHVLEGS